MSKPSLILIGAGGHARSCLDVIEQQGRYHIAGLVGLPEQRHAQHLGYAVIASDSELPELAKTYPYALITVGQIQTADHRIRLYQQATQLGFQLPVIIAHRLTTLKNCTQIVELGEGGIKRAGSYQDIVNQPAPVEPRDKETNLHHIGMLK